MSGFGAPTLQTEGSRPSLTFEFGCQGKCARPRAGSTLPELALTDVSLRRSEVSGVEGIALPFPIRIPNGRYQG